MLKIGMMLSADDEDIICEVMTEYCKQFDTIFCLDAGHDKSIDIIKSFSKVEYAVTEQQLGISGTLLKDGIRQFLLSCIQDKYGYDGWIFPIQSDEIYYGNIEDLIKTTDRQYAVNTLNCLIAHFVIHENERETIYQEDITKPIQERRLWYFMGQCEHCGFKNTKGIYYNFYEHMKVSPHGLHPQRLGTSVIIRKHYNMRSPDQVAKRVKDRLDRNWQPAYIRLKDNIFIKDPHQLITAGAIYSHLQLFDGRFRCDINPDWETVAIKL